jgi:hypothetical protein
MPTTPTTDPPRPTEEATLTTLADLIGRPLAKELWTLAVTGLNLNQPVTEPAQLRKVAELLMSMADATRVAGRALRVQVITHQALTA